MAGAIAYRVIALALLLVRGGDLAAQASDAGARMERVAHGVYATRAADARSSLRRQA